MAERQSDSSFMGYLVYSSDLLPATKRYFVLDKPARTLKYYKDSSEAQQPNVQPVGEFNLERVSQVEDLKGSKSHSCFALHYLGDKHVLQAPSLKETEEWVTSLKECSKINVVRTQSNRVSMDGSYSVAVVGDGVVKIPLKNFDKTSGLHPVCEPPTTAEARRPSSADSRPQPRSSFDKDVSPDIQAIPNLAIIKAGSCVKQGIVIKSWKRRYFVLDCESLKYYENDSCKKLKGSISVSTMTDCRASSGSIPNKDNLFEVVTAERTFLIQTDTPEEMGSWIDRIRELLRLPPLTYL